MYSSSLLRRPWAMFFVFPEGGFSTAVNFCKLPADFRPPFVAAEEGRLAAELGREDCSKSYQKNLDSLLSRKHKISRKPSSPLTLLTCNESRPKRLTVQYFSLQPSLDLFCTKGRGEVVSFAAVFWDVTQRFFCYGFAL